MFGSVNVSRQDVLRPITMEVAMSQRISEEKILIAVLQLLAKQEDKTLTTTKLIELLTLRFNPSGRDAEIIEGRSDTFFSQKVRNIVSHRHEDSGIVARGLATYNQERRPGSLTITPEGENYISTL